MPNLENLRKQAKLVLRRHRDRYYPVAAQIRAGLPRFAAMTDSEILAQSFKLGDAQELVARQQGFENWQALKQGLPTMSDHADKTVTKAVIAAAEPQLFVADVKAVLRCSSLPCSALPSSSPMASRLIMAQVKRDAARLNLRCVKPPAIAPELRDREELLSATLTVASADEIKQLFLEFQPAGASFVQTLRQNRGARAILSSGISTAICCCSRGRRRCSCICRSV